MRRPNDTKPDPPGGRAAKRLEEFLKKRAPAKPTSSEDEERPEKQQDSADTPESNEP